MEGGKHIVEGDHSQTRAWGNDAAEVNPGPGM